MSAPPLPDADDATRRVLAARAERFARPAAESDDVAGRDAVVVRAGGQRAALDVGIVAEILPPAPATSLPGAGGLVGIRNLRGEALPLADLGNVLGTGSPSPPLDRFVVVLAAHEPLGLLVDGVDGIVTLADDDVRPPHADSVADSSPVVGVAPDALVVLDGQRILRHPGLTTSSDRDTQGVD